MLITNTMPRSLSHRLHAAFLREAIAIPKRFLLGGARLVGLNIGVSESCVVGVMDLFAVLDIELLNTFQHTRGRMEPGDNLERLLGVDLKFRAWTVESLITLAIGVDVAAVTVGWGDEAITILPSTFLIAHAHIETRLLGRVWREGSGHHVRLPDIHLGTACSHVALTAVVVRIGGVRRPSLTVGLAVDPLEISGALPIAITSSVRSTGFVVGSQVAGLLHLGKVDCGIGSTRHVAQINVERNLLLEHAEQFVLLGVFHHVTAGAHIDRVWSLGDEADVNTVAVLLHTIGP